MSSDPTTRRGSLNGVIPVADGFPDPGRSMAAIARSEAEIDAMIEAAKSDAAGGSPTGAKTSAAPLDQEVRAERLTQDERRRRARLS